MSFKKVTLAGGGVLGSQIAYQTAYKGFDVTIWLRSEESVARAKEKIERLHGIYLKSIDAMAASEGIDPRTYCRGLVPDYDSFTGMDAKMAEELKAKADAAFANMKYVVDMDEAFGDADLVIEAMAENPQAKIEFYTGLAKHLPDKCVLATNSSTMLPSTFAEYTGRPDKYLALHFANEIWRMNTAEVMGHAGTDPESYKAVSEFARQIGMVPLELKKEQPGYILNSMLVPFLNAAQALFANDVADPETIDKTWMLATGAPNGPFRILDVVGLTTAYNIVMNNPEATSNPESTAAKIAAKLKEKIDEGKTGINAGEGFYKYK